MAPLRPRFEDAWGPSATLTENDLPPELLAVVVESLLYGMHAVLFPICARILYQRKRKIQFLMLAAVTIMFVLATADLAISWNLLLRHTRWLYSQNIHVLYTAVFPKFWLYLVNNVIADVLLILRCYVVWGKRKRILILPGLLLIMGTVFGITSEGTLSPSLKRYIIVYLFLDLILNVGVTVMTAGRILWIARQVKKIVGDQMTSHYHFAIAVVTESGLVYSASVVLVIALSNTNFVLMAAVISIRIVCIVPILLIVQITLGRSVEDVQTTVNKLQGGTGQQVVLDTIVSTHIEFEREVPAHSELDVEEVENTRQHGDSDSCTATDN